MKEIGSYLILNPYLTKRLDEIYQDMRTKNMIHTDDRLTENEQFIATLIAWYEATKHLHP